MRFNRLFSGCKGKVMVLTLLAGGFLSVGQMAGQRDEVPLVGLAFWIETSNGLANKIYVNQHDAVTCLDAQTGAVVWSTKASAVAVGPVLVDSTVVYMADGGFFTAYGLDAKTGKQKWSLNERSGLLVAGEKQVYLSPIGVVAVNPADGSVVWRHPMPPPGYAGLMWYYRGKVYADSEILDASTGKRTRLLDSPMRAFAAGQGRVFAADEDGKLTALDGESLKQLWQVQTPARSQPFVPEGLAAAGEYVFGVFYDGHADAAHSGEIDAYLAENGKLRWKAPLACKRRALFFHPIGADAENVYLYEPAEKEGSFMLTAFSAADGKKRWESLEPQGADGPPVVVGQEIYIGGGFHPVIVISRSSGATLRTLGEKSRNAR
jgi:outer membrane protein assembly factor BamB